MTTRLVDVVPNEAVLGDLLTRLEIIINPKVRSPTDRIDERYLAELTALLKDLQAALRRFSESEG
jgi:hypothetical protein